jgi:hypothetical protein
LLDPALVAEFVANAAALLAEAGAGDPRERVVEAEPEPVVETGQGDLPQVAAAFGDLVDLKTPFTHGHSSRWLASRECTTNGSTVPAITGVVGLLRSPLQPGCWPLQTCSRR